MSVDFSIEQDKGLAFVNGYEIRKEKLISELLKVNSFTKTNQNSKRKFISTDETVAKLKGNLSCCKSDVVYKLTILELKKGEELETIPFSKEEMNLKVEKSKKIVISIKVLNKEYKVSISLKRGEMYKDILTKISDELNLSPFGINSKVIYTKGKQGTRLSIKGEAGESNNFSIKISGDECLKNIFNIKPVNKASDYVYMIGNKKYKSSNCEISINKNVKAVILKEGVVDIISTFDTNEIVKSIEGVINKYNNFIEYLIDNKNYVVVFKELKKYQESLNSMLYELSLLGIDITLSGKVSLDRKKLKNKIIKDSMYTFRYLFKEGGFISKLLVLVSAQNISIDQIVHSTSKKAYVINYFERVNGKTMSHEPFYMIEQG